MKIAKTHYVIDSLHVGTDYRDGYVYAHVRTIAVFQWGVYFIYCPSGGVVSAPDRIQQNT
jgi:hypothetical protein